MLIVGDAGIGKSRLVQALLEEVAGVGAAAPIRLIAHGSAFAQNTPLAPLLQLLSRAIFPREEATESTGEERLDQLEAFLASTISRSPSMPRSSVPSSRSPWRRAIRHCP